VGSPARPPRREYIRLFFLILAVTPASANRAAAQGGLPDHQVYLEYRIEMDPPAVKSGKSYAKLWRAGDHYARAETSAESNGGAPSVTILSEPDFYFFNPATKRGRHAVDPDAAGKTHAPIFPTIDLRELELGREIAFFRDHHARRGPDQVVDGVNCGVFELPIDGKHLSLFIDLATKAPRMLRLRAENRGVTLRYRRYERRQTFDPPLFVPPKDVRMAETAPAGRRVETPFDVAERGQAVDTPEEIARSRSVDAEADHSDDLARLRARLEPSPPESNS